MSTVYDLNRILLPEVPPDYEGSHGRRKLCAGHHARSRVPLGTDAPSYIGYIWRREV